MHHLLRNADPNTGFLNSNFKPTGILPGHLPLLQGLGFNSDADGCAGVIQKDYQARLLIT
jgi:hypothetical protein